MNQLKQSNLFGPAQSLQEWPMMTIISKDTDHAHDHHHLLMSRTTMTTWGIGSDLLATILRKGRPSPAARKACLKNRHGDDVTILHGKLYTGLRTKTTRAEPSPTNNSIISCVVTQFPRRWFSQKIRLRNKIRIMS